MTLRIDHDGDVQVVTLNRPTRHNALSEQMHHDLIETLDAAAANAEVTAVVLTGAGASFCAGFDLTERPQPGVDLLALSNIYHHAVWTFPKPLIAAVNGPALGGGCDLAAMCDIRVASERAAFAQPQLAFGVPTIYSLLRWIIGDGRAREMCLTGRFIDAGEALEIGLVTRVVPPDDLSHCAIEIARSVAQAPSAVLQAVKAEFTAAAGRTFSDVIAREHDHTFRLMFATGNGLADRDGLPHGFSGRS